MSGVLDPDEPPTATQLAGAWLVLIVALIGIGLLLWAAL